MAQIADRLEQESRAARTPIRSFRDLDGFTQAWSQHGERVSDSVVKRGLFEKVPPDEELRVLEEFGLGPTGEPLESAP